MRPRSRASSCLALATLALTTLTGACADDGGDTDPDLATTGCSPTTLCDLSAKPLTLAMINAPRNRKSFQDLTANEKKRFTTAILELKKYKNPWNISDWKTGAILNYYDVFVEWHADLYRCDGMKMSGQTMTMVDDGWDNDMGMGAHMNPLVMPWHREYLLLFENALRQVDTWPATTPPTYISVPYWDWDATQVSSTVTPFKTDLMGPNGVVTNANHPVTSGPFASSTTFPIKVLPLTANSTSYGTVPFIPKAPGAQLARFFNSSANASVTTLPTAAEVKQASTYADAPTGVKNYDVFPWDDTVVKSNATATSFRGFADGWRNSPGGVCTYDYDNNAVDDGSIALMIPRLTVCPPGSPTTCTATTFAMHVQVHAWVGGSWGAFTSGHMNTHPSPNDPIFFMHHAYLDKIWNDWQLSAKKGGGKQWPTDPELDAQGANKSALYSVNHVMWPYRDPSYQKVKKDPSATYPANQNVLKNRVVGATYDTTLPGITATADGKALLTASESATVGAKTIYGGVSVWDVLDNALIALAHTKDGTAHITTQVAYCAAKSAAAGADWPTCPVGVAVK